MSRTDPAGCRNQQYDHGGVPRPCNTKKCYLKGHPHPPEDSADIPLDLDNETIGCVYLQEIPLALSTTIKPG